MLTRKHVLISGNSENRWQWGQKIKHESHLQMLHIFFILCYLDVCHYRLYYAFLHQSAFIPSDKSASNEAGGLK